MTKLIVEIFADTEMWKTRTEMCLSRVHSSFEDLIETD